MKSTNKLLAFAAIAEVATGVALMLVPSLVGRLLLGTELAGVAVVIGRVTGIALSALGIACWPGLGLGRAYCGMLTYSALATLYLAGVGLAGEFAGKLLWPAVVLHAAITILLGRAWLRGDRPADRPTYGAKE
jgi:hypothetical protein